MVKIWAERIIAGTRTFDEVPARYKNAVKELLVEKMGQEWFDEFSNPENPV